MQKLKILMALKDLKQIELSELSGVPVWKINKCLRHPRLFRFKQHEKEAIVRALELPEDISFEEIFTGELVC